MSMKSKKINENDLKKKSDYINPEFDDLFSTSSKSDDTKQEARMIMYRFLSEAERVHGQERGLKKKLANKTGTSQSFITQLFNGDKLINLLTLAKFQEALDIKFKIIALPTSEFDTVSVEEIINNINNSKRPILNVLHVYPDLFFDVIDADLMLKFKERIAQQKSEDLTIKAIVGDSKLALQINRDYYG